MQTMAGTLMPEEQALILQQQQPLIDALRANGSSAMAFNPSSQAFPGGSSGGMQGFAKDLVGKAAMAGLKQFGGNISAANQYGTNPFSQQTNMLQAQDAAFL